MNDGSETRRPHGQRDEPVPDERSQEELSRTSRDTGGDAPAAGSIEEREALARDEDETWRPATEDAEDAASPDDLEDPD